MSETEFTQQLSADRARSAREFVEALPFFPESVYRARITLWYDDGRKAKIDIDGIERTYTTEKTKRRIPTLLILAGVFVGSVILSYVGVWLAK